MPSVTIVIPIHNRASFLPRLFRSLSQIDYEGMEVLLVDNASTDNSLSLCRSFAEDAPMFVRVLQEPRLGANQARNCGLRVCHTEWIYFFDSDDELTASFLAELMLHVSDKDLIVFPTVMCRDGHCRRRDFVASSSPAAQILSATLNTQGMLFRTDFLRRIGGWNENLRVWQDWELGVRALLHSPRVMFLDEKAYHRIHLHADSITGPTMSSRLEERMAAMRQVGKEVSRETERRALYLRYCWLCGKLRQEACPCVPALTSLFSEQRPVPLWLRFLGNLLRRYVAWGGRGAWRIALWFC